MVMINGDGRLGTARDDGGRGSMIGGGQNFLNNWNSWRLIGD